MKSKALRVLDRSNTEIVGSNPAWGRYVCPYFAIVCYEEGEDDEK
jgi:hypothetical protein